MTDTKPIKLTKRQRQLLQMLETGNGNREIAAELGLSEHTIKVHLWRTYQVLGVTTRGQALKWWHDHRPANEMFALIAAHDAACKLVNQIKALNIELLNCSIAEFEHHRAQVLKIKGELTC